VEIQVKIRLFIFLLLLTGCEKISNEKDPAIIILGRWQLIQMGNWPVMEEIKDPNGYIEYLADSIKIERYNNPPASYQLNYWVDSLLNECIYIESGHSYVLNTKYKFEFSDGNRRMRLDFASGAAEYMTTIYRRLQ